MDYLKYTQLREKSLYNIKKYISNIITAKTYKLDQKLFVGLTYLSFLYKKNQSIDNIKFLINNNFKVKDFKKLNYNQKISSKNIKLICSFLNELLIEFSEYIVDISQTFDEDTILAMALYAPSVRTISSDLVKTPENLSNLAIRLLDIEVDDVLLDMGAGAGSFLIEAAYKSDTKKLIGIDYDENKFIIAYIRFKILGLNINFYIDD
ncbi:MAG: hypothetical protein ACOCVF_03500, partial [bacterium]